MSKDKGVVKRVFVTPDKHFPLHDKKSNKCSEESNRDCKA